MPCRHVDGHVEPTVVLVPPGPLDGPHPRLAAGLPQDPGAERHDQSAFLGQRDELNRAQQPPSGVLPAHQGLHPHQSQVMEVDDGLIVEHELRTLEGPVQFVGDPQALGRRQFVIFGVEGDPGRAEVLGAVHGHIRIAQ